MEMLGKECPGRRKRSWGRRRLAKVEERQLDPCHWGGVSQRLCNRSWCQRDDGDQFCGDFQPALGQGCTPERDGKPWRAGWRSNMIWLIADTLANILLKKKEVNSENWCESVLQNFLWDGLPTEYLVSNDIFQK